MLFVEFDKTQIKIDSAVARDEFRVVAVNYCFEKSKPSNGIKLQNTGLKCS